MSKQEQVYGVVQQRTVNKDYNGVKTESATVTVNNTDRTISVDVNFVAGLGNAPDKAYPGSQGAINREAILELQEERGILEQRLEAEESRAIYAESNLRKQIAEVGEASNRADAMLKQSLEHLNDKVEHEDQQLNTRVNNLTQHVTDEVARLDSTDQDIKTKLEENTQQLTTAIHTLEDNMHQEIDMLSTKVQESDADIVDKIQHLDNVLSGKIEDSYDELITKLKSVEVHLLEEQAILRDDTETADKAINKRIDELDAEVLQHVETIKNSIDINVATLRDDIDTLHSDLDVQINSLELELKETNETVELNLDHLTQEDARIRAQLKESKAEVLTKIDDLQRELTSEIQAVETSCNGRYNDLATALEEISVDLDDFKWKTEQQFSTLDTRLTEVVNTTSLKFDNVNTNLEGLSEEIDETQKRVDLVQSLAEGTALSFQTFSNATLEVLGDQEKALNNHEQQLTSHNNRITAIETTYASKEYVKDSIAQYSSLSKQIAEDVDLDNDKVIIDGQAKDPESGVIYLVKEADKEQYKQYTLVGTELVLIGTTEMNLDGYASEKYVDDALKNYYTKSEIDSRLENIKPDDYYTTTEVDNLLHSVRDEIPDVQEFIEQIPTDYVKSEDLTNTLEDYATKEDLNKVTPDVTGQIEELLSNIKFIDGGNSFTISI